MNEHCRLNVITYNMGTQVDYGWVCQHNEISFTHQGYQNSQNKTAEYFKNLPNDHKPDVIMLQEVYKRDRPLLKVLKSEGFKLFNVMKTKAKTERTAQRVDDCAILLRKSRFQDGLNYSAMIREIDTPIIIATDNVTKQKVMFVTAHVPGLSLEVGGIEPQNSARGDGYIQAVIDRMTTLSHEHHIKVEIIGADMNANPEILDQDRNPKDQWEHRFKKLDTAGFLTHRTREITEIFPKGNYRERELDFIFSRENKFSKSDFAELITDESVVLAGKTKALLNFDLDEADKLPTNASDHRPVMTEFMIKIAPT